MVNIDNAFGKSIELLGSRELLSNQNKIEPITGNNYLIFGDQAEKYAASLGVKLGCSRTNIIYLYRLCSLARVTGGDALIQYVNSNIKPGKEILSYKKMFEKNAASLYKDRPIGADELQVVSEVLDKKCTLLESLAIVYGDIFNFLFYSMTKEDSPQSLTIMEAIGKINHEMELIINQVKSNQSINLSPEMMQYYQSLEYRQNLFDQSELGLIFDSVSRYNNDAITFDDLLSKIDSLNISYEKKTGIGRVTIK